MYESNPLCRVENAKNDTSYSSHLHNTMATVYTFLTIYIVTVNSVELYILLVKTKSNTFQIQIIR